VRRGPRQTGADAAAVVAASAGVAVVDMVMVAAAGAEIE
jgi:hypothetical protein